MITLSGFILKVKSGTSKGGYPIQVLQRTELLVVFNQLPNDFYGLFHFIAPWQAIANAKAVFKSALRRKYLTGCNANVLLQRSLMTFIGIDLFVQLNP